MKYAINELKVALSTLENNEPINRKDGNHAQADLEANNAAEIRQALHILEAVEHARVPLYPNPDGTVTT